MTEYTVRPLAPGTWDAFARLAERHNGVWGGCWCTWFHVVRKSGAFYRYDGDDLVPAEKQPGPAGNRALKQQLVKDGRAHAALVFDGEVAVAWCEYGTPGELPNIYHRKEYEAALDRLPDYRITCFFVDRDYRRTGVAAVALSGAVELIARAGGGVVEAYPHDIADQKVSASFLYNGTRSMFEQAGFRYDRPKGAKNCVMTKTVTPG
jgi:GNAT superfamily N-acetyltransferase